MKLAAVAEPEPPQPGDSGRLLSLDVFRGATMASMILVNNPGSWNDVYPPLRHAVWHGVTFTDLIFPFFLWITGVAMTFSFARRQQKITHILRRSTLIFLLGLFLNGFPFFDLATLRIPGVLQRIAVCYLAAAFIYLYTGTRGRILWTAGLLAVYLLLMRGGYNQDSNFARHVDGLLLSGHMWSQTKDWDPEGIISTIPAIATTLFGILTGELIRSRRAPADVTSWMFVAGGALTAAGLALDPLVPLNKNLWTSSYSIFTGGLASMSLAFCYWLIDVQGYRRWARPFAIFGMNAIVIYVLSGVIARLLGLWGLKTTIYERVFTPLASPVNASALYGLANVAVLLLIAWLMYSRRWFVRV